MMADDLERLAEIETEMRGIDAILARRPALDGLQTRRDKIERAISTASRADEALERLAEVERERDHYRARKDGAYEERNRVVAALASMGLANGWRAGRTRTDIPGWDAEWHGCVYIETPAGQLSWHFHDSQAHLFTDLPAYDGAWDGHDTPEKYRRLAAISPVAVADPREAVVAEDRS